MDEESLHDLVQFLSEATLTDITAVGNTKVENTELGRSGGSLFLSTWTIQVIHGFFGRK